MRNTAKKNERSLKNDERYVQKRAKMRENDERYRFEKVPLIA